jgi:hypothetical protein
MHICGIQAIENHSVSPSGENILTEVPNALLLSTLLFVDQSGSMLHIIQNPLGTTLPIPFSMHSQYFL